MFFRRLGSGITFFLGVILCFFFCGTLRLFSYLFPVSDVSFVFPSRFVFLCFFLSLFLSSFGLTPSTLRLYLLFIPQLLVLHHLLVRSFSL